MVRGPLTDAERGFCERHLHVVEESVRQMRAKVPIRIETCDLVQEGRVGLLTAARSYDPVYGTPADYWARSCVRRQILEAVRRNWTWSTLSVPMSESAAAADSPLDPETAETPRSDRLHAAIERAKARMTERQRQVVELLGERVTARTRWDRGSGASLRDVRIALRCKQSAVIRAKRAAVAVLEEELAPVCRRGQSCG